LIYIPLHSYPSVYSIFLFKSSEVWKYISEKNKKKNIYIPIFTKRSAKEYKQRNMISNQLNNKNGAKTLTLIWSRKYSDFTRYKSVPFILYKIYIKYDR